VRRVDYLPKLQQQACRRLLTLKEGVPQPGQRIDQVDIDRRVAFATIEAANVWNFFCRSFYLSCAFGARDGAGVRVVGGQRFRTTQDALWFAIQQVNPTARSLPGPVTPYREPDWHQTGV